MPAFAGMTSKRVFQQPVKGLSAGVKPTGSRETFKIFIQFWTAEF
jgi:hypothetical protein